MAIFLFDEKFLKRMLNIGEESKIKSLNANKHSKGL